MPLLHTGNHAMIKGGTLVWDAITKPEVNDGGNTRWAAKVVFPPGHPDIQILEQLANEELQRSEFRGILPNGGLMPIGTAGPNEFNGQFPGWHVVNASTFQVPKVHCDVNPSVIMQPMEYSNLMYQGQNVDIIVFCKAYNNKSKGIAARLEGILLNTQQNAQQQSFGGSSFDSGSAFGGGDGGQQNGQQQQGGSQQQNNQQQNGQQQNGQQQQGGFQQPQQQQGGSQQQNNQPQQAQDFLPQQ